MRYILLLILLSSCSHLTPEQQYYLRNYEVMCYYRVKIVNEDSKKQQEYYNSMCLYAQELENE
jgi:hypothetical protein